MYAIWYLLWTQGGAYGKRPDAAGRIFTIPPPPPPIQNSTPYQMQMAVEEGGSESWSGINYEHSPAVVAHYG